jgi:glycosyltransferase involved in cell wall biosynthesis
MKVLWLGHRDSEHPRAGGAERSILEIGSRLARRGHQVTLITVAWPGASSEALLAGIRVRRFPGSVLTHLASISALRSVEPDVVVDDLAHAAPWFSPWFTSAPGTAFFHHLHGRTLRGQTSLPLRLVLTVAERLYPGLYRKWPIVTESRTAVQDLIRLGESPDRISCIPPGCDLELFHPGPKSADPRLVYFGGMRKYKRPEIVIEVLELLHKSGWPVSLTIVGTGPQLDSVRRRSQESGLIDFIDFAGRLSDAQVAQRVAEAWVNIHSSVSEGWGFSVTEAAACGTPTVSFAVPGIVDSVEDGITGLLVPEGDVKGLADACATIMKEPNIWSHRCAEKGRVRNWDVVVEEWERHLETVVREGSRFGGTEQPL